jgi:hypothetical protein
MLTPFWEVRRLLMILRRTPNRRRPWRLPSIHPYKFFDAFGLEGELACIAVDAFCHLTYRNKSGAIKQARTAGSRGKFWILGLQQLMRPERALKQPPVSKGEIL